MRRNRFEHVDEVQDDAITLELSPDGDVDKARVHVPPASNGDGGERFNTSDLLAKVDAFRGAVKLANTLKLPIVVMDHNGNWDSNWGDLFRPV